MGKKILPAKQRIPLTLAITPKTTRRINTITRMTIPMMGPLAEAAKFKMKM
jgi:hypothetical protein